MIDLFVLTLHNKISYAMVQQVMESRSLALSHMLPMLLMVTLYGVELQLKYTGGTKSYINK